jgi:hypothetical protein
VEEPEEHSQAELRREELEVLEEHGEREARREPERFRETSGAAEPAVEWISEDARYLARQARELRERGRLDDAEELMARAERIERSAREMRERREASADEIRRRTEPEFINDDAYALARRAEALAREGRTADAEELMERARRIEREYRARRDRSERDEVRDGE